MILLAAACGGNHAQPDAAPPPDAPATFDQCGADPASVVRQTFLALDGRRPLSQAEVDVYVDLYTQAQALGDDPKATVADAIMTRPEFTERWADVLMDAMHVQRVDIQSEQSCWDHGQRANIDAGLATAVRDLRATGSSDGKGAWTMIDLARSSLALDDISPIYRAQIFSMVYHPIPAANVDAVHAELARRDDFGTTFDSGFLHRNVVCLDCHNSEHSVTDNDDPNLDRFWPVPGLPESGIYGDSSGEDPDKAHAMFRVDSFDDAGRAHPWGWNAACGEFTTTVPPDIAGIDANLADITGQTSTVYTLEASLAKGFDALRGNAPPIQADGSIADPDTALAWLVTLKITEDVWHEVTGTNLTIANYFPRNKAASDQLYSLATTFTQSKFSLRALVAAIVASDYFDRKAPETRVRRRPVHLSERVRPVGDLGSGPGEASERPGRRDPAGVAAHARGGDQRGARVAAAARRDALPRLRRGRLRGPRVRRSRRRVRRGRVLQHVPVGVREARAAAVGRAAVRARRRHVPAQQRGRVRRDRLPGEPDVGRPLRRVRAAYGVGAAGLRSTGSLAAGAADATATASDLVVALKDRLVGEPAIADGAEHDGADRRDRIGDLTAAPRAACLAALAAAGVRGAARVAAVLARRPRRQGRRSTEADADGGRLRRGVRRPRGVGHRRAEPRGDVHAGGVS